MADEIITVRGNSVPGDETFVLRNRQNRDDPNAVIDVTAYAFKLIVKAETPDDPDSAALFDLTGSVVTGASGTYKFALTIAHTQMGPGTYPAEIRYWSGGAPGTEEPPTGSRTVDYIVTQPVRINEP